MLRNATGTTEHLPAIFCMQLLLAMCIPASMFTMNLFAHERASGTIETLMSAPVTDAQVVLGKFLAAFIMTCLAIAIACLVLPAYLAIAAPPPRYSTLSLATGIASTTLFAAMWCSLGTLLSLLSRHQAPPAIITLIISLDSRRFTGNIRGLMAQEQRFALISQTSHAATADSRIIFFAVSTTLFLLFCAVRVLESRRWASSK